MAGVAGMLCAAAGASCNGASGSGGIGAWSFGSVFGGVSGGQPADVVIVNGRVWTVDPSRPEAEAVAIVGDRIVAVGARADVEKRRGPNTRVVDAGGRFVMPGFNDAHVHLMTGGAQLDSVDLKDAATPEEFRALMQARQETALADLQGAHFDVPEPIRRVDVKLAPPGGALGAFYVGPSEDFTRPGTVWFAIGEQQVVPIFDQVTTNYHEGFPGHHLQNGIQMISPARLSRYQKMLVWYPGSGEGWALYAEDIMEELGYLEKPDYLMGKLAGEMLAYIDGITKKVCTSGIDVEGFISKERRAGWQKIAGGKK